MKVTAINVTLDNSDNPNRDFELKAEFIKGSDPQATPEAGPNGESVRNGEVLDKETRTSLATFSSYGADQLTPVFNVSTGRGAILEAIEGFIADGREVVNNME